MNKVQTASKRRKVNRRWAFRMQANMIQYRSVLALLLFQGGAIEYKEFMDRIKELKEEMEALVARAKKSKEDKKI